MLDSFAPSSKVRNNDQTSHTVRRSLVSEWAENIADHGKYAVVRTAIAGVLVCLCEQRSTPKVAEN